MLRILIVLLGLIFSITLIYFAFSIGIKYSIKFSNFFSGIFSLKKFNFNLFSVVEKVEDHHDGTPGRIIERKRKFHAPKLLEFDFYNSEYNLLSGLGYSCDLPLEKRFLNSTIANEIGKVVLFTNEITEIYNEDDSIPEEYKQSLNIYCMDKKFVDFEDNVFKRFFKIFSKEYLKNTDRNHLAKYEGACVKSISGWLTPNSILQAYSYAVNIVNYLHNSGNNDSLSVLIETSLLHRIHLYSQIVEASMKYAIVIKLNNPNLYNAMLTTESFDFPGSEELFKIFQFKTNSLSNFCNDKINLETCNCPRLRSLYNSIGLNKMAVMNNAAEDLKKVHDKLMKILKSSPNSPSALGLMMLLNEYSPGEQAWLRETLTLFLYEVCNSYRPQFMDGKIGIIRSVNALNKELICTSPTSASETTANQDQKCIPQEIINWLWKADITIEQIYAKTLEFTKYSKLLLYPLLLRVKSIGESMKDKTTNVYSMNLFGTNAQILEYFLFAMEISRGQEKEKRALPPPTSVSWTFSQFNNELYFTLGIDEKDVTDKLTFCSKANRCRFEDFSKFLLSEAGYFRHFDTSVFRSINSGSQSVQRQIYSNLCL